MICLHCQKTRTNTPYESYSYKEPVIQCSSGRSLKKEKEHDCCEHKKKSSAGRKNMREISQRKWIDATTSRHEMKEHFLNSLFWLWHTLDTAGQPTKTRKERRAQDAPPM
jgi:hypothetical protein